MGSQRQAAPARKQMITPSYGTQLYWDLICNFDLAQLSQSTFDTFVVLVVVTADIYHQIISNKNLQM